MVFMGIQYGLRQHMCTQCKVVFKQRLSEPPDPSNQWCTWLQGFHVHFRFAHLN